MAVFRSSGLVGEISGSVGGVTFATGKGSRVVRLRPVKRSHYSDAVLEAQAAYAAAVAVWQAATDAEREAWRVYARQNPLPNRVGESRQITGFAFYIRFVLSYFDAPIDSMKLPPAQSLIYQPAFTGAAFFEGGPWLVTAWGLPTPSGGKFAFLTESAFMQRGRGLAQFSGWNRFRRVGSFFRTAPTQDVYSALSTSDLELFDGERFAWGARWSGNVTMPGPVSWGYSTVGGVPFEVDYFGRSDLNPYAGNLSTFSMTSADVVVGSQSLQGDLTNAGVAFRGITALTGLPLLPVRGVDFRVYMNVVNANVNALFFQFGYQDANNYYTVRLNAAGTCFLQRLLAGATTTLVSAAIPGFAVNTWFRYEVGWGPGSLISVDVYSLAGSLLLSMSVNDSSFDAGGIGYSISNLAGVQAIGRWNGVAVSGKAV